MQWAGQGGISRQCLGNLFYALPFAMEVSCVVLKGAAQSLSWLLSSTTASLSEIWPYILNHLYMDLWMQPQCILTCCFIAHPSPEDLKKRGWRGMLWHAHEFDWSDGEVCRLSASCSFSGLSSSSGRTWSRWLQIGGCSGWPVVSFVSHCALPVLHSILVGPLSCMWNQLVVSSTQSTRSSLYMLRQALNHKGYQLPSPGLVHQSK